MTRRLTTLVVLEAELLEDRPDVLLDGPLREHERLGDRGVAPALGHLGEDLPLARRQIVERRGVALAIGGEQLLDEARIDRRAALGDDLDRGEELAPVVDPFLEQVAAALGPVLEQGQRIAAPAYWLSTTTPTSGCVSRSRRATRMPSSSPDGGIRMSVITTSGGSASIAASSESPSANDGDEVDASIGAEDLVQRLADQVGVIGDGEPDRPFAAGAPGTVLARPGTSDQRPNRRVGLAGPRCNQAATPPEPAHDRRLPSSGEPGSSVRPYSTSAMSATTRS